MEDREYSKGKLVVVAVVKVLVDMVEVVRFVTQGYHFFRTLCSGSILMVRGRHFCLVICCLSPCIVHAVVSE